MKITIIGAGIGGLTAAISLKQKGFQVEVYESAKAFSNVGAGINLAINAMQIFKKLGIDQEIITNGSYTRSMIITDPNLKVITNVDMKESEIDFKAKSIAIHRASLHNILLDNLKDIPVHLNKKLQSVIQTDNKVELVFADGTQHTTDILIGADGIHSAVRQSIFPDSQIRSARQICWRGITKIQIPEKYQIELNEMWGPGKRFGFVHINKDEIYWYALADEDTKHTFETLDQLFSDFHPVVNQIINSTESNRILTNKMFDLNHLPMWHDKNICLIGDAAHATTPNLGQGACQAIESAFVLAQNLKKYDQISDAFKNYEKVRQKRAKEIVDLSWRIGKISHLKNKLMIKVRNVAMRLIPDRLSKKQSAKNFKLEYL